MVTSEVVFIDDVDVGASDDGYVSTTMSLPLNWSVGTVTIAPVLLKTHIASLARLLVSFTLWPSFVPSVSNWLLCMHRFPPHSLHQRLSTPCSSLLLRVVQSVGGEVDLIDKVKLDLRGSNLGVI